MKKKIILFSAFAGLTSLALSSYSSGPSVSLGNRTGSAGSTTGCSAGGSCHGGLSTSHLSLNITVLDGTTQVASYVPGRQYTIAFSAINNFGGHPKYGFQASCVKTANNQQAGVFATGGAPNTVVRSAGALQIVEHTQALTGTVAGGFNHYDNSFHWTAPAAGTGAVKLYMVVNSVNANGQADAGDEHITATKDLSEATTGISTVKNTLNITVYPTPARTTLHLKVAGGMGKNATVAIYDISGRMLQQQAVSAGTDEATIQTGTLAAGHYVAVVSNETGRGVMNFVKD